MVWASNREKGVVGAGFARASARRLAAYVDASVEDITGMALLLGGDYTFLEMLSPHVSGM